MVLVLAFIFLTMLFWTSSSMETVLRLTLMGSSLALCLGDVVQEHHFYFLQALELAPDDETGRVDVVEEVLFICLAVKRWQSIPDSSMGV